MKNKLILLLFFTLIGAGIYYLDQTNQDFKKEVSELMNRSKAGVESVNTVEPVSIENKEKKLTRKRISKTIKPDAFHLLDEYARKAPRQSEKNIRTLAEYLIKPAANDLEKVRVLYTWIATNVNYDDDAYNSENYPDYSAENVLKSKRAVCEGYSNLMKALCEAAGLEAEKVIGYSKGYSYKVGKKITKTNHAWNVVKIDDKWHLFDVTWGSGSGTTKKGKLVSTTKFNPYWFDVDPYAFIFTHLPEQPRWQLTEGSLSLDKYVSLPYLNYVFFKLGFNPVTIYREALSGKTTEFVETFPLEFPVKAVQFPTTKNVFRNQEIKFEIESEYVEEIALIDGKDWKYFKKDTNTFTISYIPKGEKLDICVKINWFDKNFSTIARYEVIDGGSIAVLD